MFRRGCHYFFVVFLVVACEVDAFHSHHERYRSLRRANTDLGHPAMSTTAKRQATNDDEDAPPTPRVMLKAGFVGCGTIASAIATGLAAPAHAAHLARHGLALASVGVTRRSEAKSTQLREEFPGVVTVYDSAEEVVRNADVVFLCVLPQLVEGVLGELTRTGAWRAEHTLISLVSTSTVVDLIHKTGLPKDNVYKMICLPAIAKREGCALLQPAPRANAGDGESSVGSIDVKNMLNALGGCVECADDDMMNTMMVTTAMMGPVYGVMRNNRDFLVKQGIPAATASYFVGRSYLSMVQDAERDCRDPDRFDALIEEQTPGGLNEQCLGNLEKQEVFDSYDRSMDAVLSRLQGKSDGSLPLNP